MTRISSRQTFFLKRVFPAVWFGLLALAVLGVAGVGRRPRSEYGFLLIPAFMALVGYFVMKHLIFRLADEVWDAGSELIVKKSGQEAHVPLSQIVNVSYERFTNPPLVTLTLREPGVLGKEIVFSPPARFVPFARSPIVDDLILRVDAARRLR